MTSETPDTPSTEALTPEPWAYRRGQQAFYHDPKHPDRARIPHSHDVCELLATLDAERAVRQEAADTSGLPVGAYVASALMAANIECDSGEDVDRFLAELAKRGYRVAALETPA